MLVGGAGEYSRGAGYACGGVRYGAGEVFGWGELLP